MRDQFVVGGTFRLAHTNFISNFSNEAVSVWDLSTVPSTWRLNPAQQSYGNAVPYTTLFGDTFYGVLGRDTVNNGYTGVSDLYDSGFFAQNRLVLTPQLSLLLGTRIDFLQDHSRDRLSCSANGQYTCADYLPDSHTSAIFALGSANVSVLYKLTPEASVYATFDWNQTPPNPNGGVGGINLFGQMPDGALLRSNNFLYEAGAKFNLLGNRLFISSAVFEQKHAVPAGNAGNLFQLAETYGVEIEGNYQPTRNLFATASYSFVRTLLNAPPLFYDFPAQPGENVDGGGLYATFLPNQKIQQPDQPQQLINFLGNYKFDNGLGFRTGLQVTSSMSLTGSSYMDVSGLIANNIPLPTASLTPTNKPNVYYYRSPVIPWQFTWNMATFYDWQRYTATLSIYNVTNRWNLQASPAFYGNDFVVRSAPRTFELRLTAKF
jgi:hypothetical protein